MTLNNPAPAAHSGNKLTVYVPPALMGRLAILPPRSVSAICQAALLAAVEQAERQRDDAVALAFAED
jgi:hypothetical protein